MRADYEEDLCRLEGLVRNRAEELVREEGLTVSYEEHDFFPETVNDAETVEQVRKAAAAIGRPVIEMKHSFRASEDFGYYLKKCPGAGS